MASNLESAYISVVIIANGLKGLKHARAEDAAALKAAIAQAIVNPAHIQNPEFQKIWKTRTELNNLPLTGDIGAAVTKHAAILQTINL